MSGSIFLITPAIRLQRPGTSATGGSLMLPRLFPLKLAGIVPSQFAPSPPKMQINHSALNVAILSLDMVYFFLMTLFGGCWAGHRRDIQCRPRPFLRCKMGNCQKMAIPRTTCGCHVGYHLPPHFTHYRTIKSAGLRRLVHSNVRERRPPSKTYCRQYDFI
jgi:hypothetical protein